MLIIQIPSVVKGAMRSNVCGDRLMRVLNAKRDTVQLNINAW